MPEQDTRTTPANLESAPPRLQSHAPRWIALGYVAFGAAWIFITDRILVSLDLPPVRNATLQTRKGWLFVFLSGVLLYLLLAALQRRNDAAVRALWEHETEISNLNADLERRVAERTAQLEATNRELESFAYAVSHDLRAPLRSMSGFSQLLHDAPSDALDDKSRHYLKRINEASRRMSSLIEDLLGLSRINRTELVFRPIDFSQLIADAATAVRERYPNRSVALAIEAGMQAQGDARLLKLAMENLLDNAWKYTARSTAPSVTVGSQYDAHGRTFFVRDNGVGFDMAYSGKLFGPFQRLHSDAEFPGTGIGLVTVQRILARHGGRIWAQAEPGRGATFYFTLTEP